SSRWLLVPGVADSLRRATGGRGRSVAVSLKERSAVLVTGQEPDLAVWYDEDQPAMTTGSSYVDALPRWLFELERTAPVAGRLSEVWRPAGAELLARLTGGGDDQPGEGPGVGGLGKTFPHDLGRAADPAKALVATPMGTDLVFDTAE